MGSGGEFSFDAAGTVKVGKVDIRVGIYRSV
jgi:hypothetical protein